MGSRRGLEAWPRRFCITRLVTVIRLTECPSSIDYPISIVYAMYKRTGSQHVRVVVRATLGRIEMIVNCGEG